MIYLDGQFLGLLSLVRMVRSFVDPQLLEHGASERTLRQHSFHSILQDECGMLPAHLFGRSKAFSARVAAIAEVLLLQFLIPGKTHLLCVHDHDEVARVDVRRVLGFVLATQNGSDARGQATDDLVGCIHDEPLALYRARLCRVCLEAVRVHESSIYLPYLTARLRKGTP